MSKRNRHVTLLLELLALSVWSTIMYIIIRAAYITLVTGL